MKFSATPGRTLVRSRSRSRRHLVVALSAPAAPEDQQRPSANIAFVLDRSGSMNGRKFELARQAVRRAVHRLSRGDLFSIVVYDNRVDVVFALAEASQEGQAEALQRLDAFRPRGTTNLSEGWLQGCFQVGEQLDEGRIGRCLLLTDGLANRGITDAHELAHHATQLRLRGVSTSTFGVGADFDEVLLGQLADAGGGAFYFIDRPEQIPTLIDQELGETLEIVARQVRLRVRHPNGITVTPLGPYPVEPTEDGVTIQLPDLVSEQEIDLPVRLSFPSGDRGQTVPVEISLEDRDGVLDSTPIELCWTYAGHKDNDAQPRNRSIDRLVARRYADMAREEASRLNRDGRYRAAARRLEGVIDRIERYAGDDAMLLGLIRKLRGDAESYGKHIEEIRRKAMYYETSTAVRSGDIFTGTKRKRRSST